MSETEVIDARLVFPHLGKTEMEDGDTLGVDGLVRSDLLPDEFRPPKPTNWSGGAVGSRCYPPNTPTHGRETDLQNIGSLGHIVPRVRRGGGRYLAAASELQQDPALERNL